MATRKKPTNPSDITPAMLEKALRDRDAYQADRAAKKPSKVLALRNESTLKMLQTERWDRIPPEVIKEKISSAFVEIDEKVSKVRKSKLRSITDRLLSRSKRETVGHETPERAERARDGIDKERLSANDGHQRARIRSPMALSEEVTFREGELLAAARDKREPSEPPLRGSRFDVALEHADGPILRWVLSRYVVDHLIGHRQDGSREMSGVASDPHTRLPLTEEQQKALSRIAFVHEHISPNDRKDLEQFKYMVIAPEAHQEVVSMSEYGRKRSGYSLKDDRFPEGVFVGIMLKIAERLHDIYRLRELPSHLVRKLTGES